MLNCLSLKNTCKTERTCVTCCIHGCWITSITSLFESKQWGPAIKVPRHNSQVASTKFHVSYTTPRRSKQKAKSSPLLMKVRDLNASKEAVRCAFVNLTRGFVVQRSVPRRHYLKFVSLKVGERELSRFHFNTEIGQ